MASKKWSAGKPQTEVIDQLAAGLEVVPAKPSGGYARLQKAGKTIASLHPRKNYVRVIFGRGDEVRAEAKNVAKVKARLADMVTKALASEPDVVAAKRAPAKKTTKAVTPRKRTASKKAAGTSR